MHFIGDISIHYRRECSFANLTMSDKKPKKFPDLIKEAGLTYSVIAEALGTSRNTLRAKKDNNYSFTIKEIIVIANLLKRTPTAVLKSIMRDLEEDDPKGLEELDDQANTTLEKHPRKRYQRE